MGFTLKNEYVPRYTISDLELLEDSYELIDGIIYLKTPRPSIEHQDINLNILYRLRQLMESCSECMAYLPINWKLDEDTVVQPDGLVVCGEKPIGVYLTKTPVLIFEIISPSSELKDRSVKFDLYFFEKVKYYVIISSSTRLAEV